MYFWVNRFLWDQQHAFAVLGLFVIHSWLLWPPHEVSGGHTMLCACGPGEVESAKATRRTTLLGLVPSACCLYFPLFKAFPLPSILFSAVHSVELCVWWWNILEILKLKNNCRFSFTLNFYIMYLLVKFCFYKLLGNVFPVYNAYTEIKWMKSWVIDQTVEWVINTDHSYTR